MSKEEKLIDKLIEFIINNEQAINNICYSASDSGEEYRYKSCDGRCNECIRKYFEEE